VERVKGGFNIMLRGRGFIYVTENRNKIVGEIFGNW
jgi:hypothetical protein